MEHIPAPTIMTVLPETVQTPVVVEVKLTRSPEPAVALTVNGAALAVTPAQDPEA